MPSCYADVSDFPTYARRGTLNDAQVLAYLTQASAEADDYLAKREDFPLSAWSQSLTLHVVDIAVWRAMRDIGFKPGTTDAETIRQGYDDAMKWLSDVATGKADPARPGNVDGAPDPGPAEPIFVQSQVSGSSDIALGREADFFGHSSNNPPGMVGEPRLRGW